MHHTTFRCSSSVDLEARHPLLKVGSSNRLDINEARARLSLSAGGEHDEITRYDCSDHIETVTLRFSPRFGFSPVSCALTNSNAATALLDGPSHSSAVSG
jgi:hypothetical protein